MTGEPEQARLLAERIARRVSESRNDNSSTGERRHEFAVELSSMRASLDDLKQRLVQIETRLTHDESDATQTHRVRSEQPPRKPETASTTAYHSNIPTLSGIYVPVGHPSAEKFDVEEATIAELVDFFEGEKKCDLEPGGKPCDHCAMCSSRGF